MDIKIVSDQHFEFRDEKQIEEYMNLAHPEDKPKTDVCVMAGDISIIRGIAAKYIKNICDRENQVLYVPGNHDYYHGTSMENVDGALHTIEEWLPNFKVLKTGEVFEYQGKRFLGDTMWVPNTLAMYHARHNISDYELIPGVVREAGARNRAFLEWLQQDLQAGDIVVTHHLPSEKSTPVFFLGSVLQPWFVCPEAESIIVDKKPALWIHGHTHTKCDYMIENTRIFCNPLGYPREARNLANRITPHTIRIQ